MLLRVPSATHDLAMSNGFDLYSTPNRYTVCSQCDGIIQPKESCYSLAVYESSVDLWCASCIETKLPEHLAAGRPLR